MAKIDLAAAKLHLRIDPDVNEEDSLISSWILAAYLAIEGEIFRKVYDAADAIPVDDLTGMATNEALNAAALIIVGHLYVNRDAEAAEIPMGAAWLLRPYTNTAGGF